MSIMVLKIAYLNVTHAQIVDIGVCEISIHHPLLLIIIACSRKGK